MLPLPASRNLWTYKAVPEILTSLKEDSGTGPDLLPAQILKICAKELAEPVCRLTQRILDTGMWPTLWTLHWIVPLLKKTNKQCFRCEELQGNTLDGAAVESGGAAIEVLVCALLDYNRQLWS